MSDKAIFIMQNRVWTAARNCGEGQAAVIQDTKFFNLYQIVTFKKRKYKKN